MSNSVESYGAVERTLGLGSMQRMADAGGGGASHQEGGARSVLAVEAAGNQCSMAHME